MTKHSSPTKKEIAENGLLLRTVVGSTVHGLSVKSQDDRDEMGICTEPPQYLIGYKTFDQYEFRTKPDGERSGPGDLDYVCYSLRKWLRLALAGNPTILIPLFVSSGQVLQNTDHGRYLRSARHSFLSQQSVRNHLGYLHNQRERMLGLRGGMDVNRPELVEAYGYDTKYAGHMIRLGVQGFEIVTTGDLTLPMEFLWKRRICDIRVGKYTKEEVLEMAANLEADIESAIPRSDLPTHANSAKWTDWMIQVYYEYWQKLAEPPVKVPEEWQINNA